MGDNPEMECGWKKMAMAGLLVLLGFALVTCVKEEAVKESKSKEPKALKAPPKKAKRNKAYRKVDNPNIKVTDLGARTQPIIDIHEHLQTMDEAKRLLKAMDGFNIKRTCLMSSSHYTFTLDKKYGFERFKENNDLLIEVKKAYPERFCAFVTIHPPDENNLKLLQDYVAAGADGLKLYLGHGAGTGKGPFHMMPLDDPKMLPIYEWAQKTQLPILFHVNLIKYFDEFVRVMERFPYLRVSLPHFGLHKNTSKRLARLTWLFDRYPNLYTDISFGHPDFQRQGFEAMSKWRGRSKKFMERHADRIMFATDMVLEKTKTEAYIDDTLRAYMQWIESREFRFSGKPELTMWGLHLSQKALQEIYWQTPSAFLLLDESGALPNRAKAWPPQKLAGLPPLVAPVKPLPADYSLPPQK